MLCDFIDLPKHDRQTVISVLRMGRPVRLIDTGTAPEMGAPVRLLLHYPLSPLPPLRASPAHNPRTLRHVGAGRTAHAVNAQWSDRPVSLPIDSAAKSSAVSATGVLLLLTPHARRRLVGQPSWHGEATHHAAPGRMALTSPRCHTQGPQGLAHGHRHHRPLFTSLTSVLPRILYPTQHCLPPFRSRLSRKDNSVNSTLHRLNKFGTLTTAAACIAFLGAVTFQSLYPLVSTSPTEGRTTSADASHVSISMNHPLNTQPREAIMINVAAADVHFVGSSDLTVTDAIQTNTVDTAVHIVNWRPVPDEHPVTGTFNHEGAGAQAFFRAASTPEAVPALRPPTASATTTSSTGVQPSPEKAGQTTFTDIPGGIIAASTIILTLVIVLARRRRSPSAEG